MLAGQFLFDLYISILRKVSFVSAPDSSVGARTEESHGMAKPGMPILKGADKGPVGFGREGRRLWSREGD